MANDDTLSIYNCCESPDKLYTDNDTRSWIDKVGTKTTITKVNELNKKEQTCVSCDECKSIYDEVLATLTELGQDAVRPSSATPTDIKTNYDKFNEEHCDLFIDDLKKEDFSCEVDVPDDDTTTPTTTSTEI